MKPSLFDLLNHFTFPCTFTYLLRERLRRFRPRRRGIETWHRHEHNLWRVYQNIKSSQPSNWYFVGENEEKFRYRIDSNALALRGGRRRKERKKVQQAGDGFGVRQLSPANI